MTKIKVSPEEQADRQARAELARQLIEIGYKRLRCEIRPKLASSKEPMKRLRRARKRLMEDVSRLINYG